MGLKKVSVAPEKKEAPKKEAVKVSTKKEEPKKKEVTIKKPATVETPIVKQAEDVIETSTKKEWDGVSLVGKNDTINKFKGIVKGKGEIVGKILLDLMKEYNERNK